MPIRTIATLVVAVVLGLIGVVVLNSYLAGSPKARVPRPVIVASVPVVVAAQPIGRGVTLQPGLLKVMNYPQGAAPPGAFGAVAQLTGEKQTQRVALHAMAADEPILAGAVSAPGGRLNLAAVIDPGMQAVAIHSSDVQGVGGFLIPGDRVDVLLTRVVGQAPSLQQQNTITQVLAENLRVLGIDQSDDETVNKPAVAHAITIEVTPAQAQAITLGQTVGAVSLSLRHVADTAPLARRATTVAQLGFAAPAVAAPRSAPRGEAIHVTRVTDTTDYNVGGR